VDLGRAGALDRLAASSMRVVTSRKTTTAPRPEAIISGALE
jgi:hypothetical protein